LLGQARSAILHGSIAERGVREGHVIRVEDFTVRERNVLTLPQGIREVSHLNVGTQGKAVALREGIVMLIADPLLVDEFVAHFASWLEDHAAADPWAHLNEALAADRLDKVPAERYIASPEDDLIPNLDRISEQYADDLRVAHPERYWQE
jgi:hypothetical protein